MAMKMTNENMNAENKTGSLFLRGMLYDVPKVARRVEEEPELDAYYASLAWLYLQREISQKAVLKSLQMVDDKWSRHLFAQHLVQFAYRPILEQLMDAHPCKNLQELGKTLDTACGEVPAWVSEWGRDLCRKICAGLFGFEDHLYYVTDSGRFLRLSMEGPGEDGTLDEPEEEGMPDGPEARYEVLGKGYDRIVGFDSDRRMVYLGLPTQTTLYHAFDLNTETFSVIMPERERTLDKCFDRFVKLDRRKYSLAPSEEEKSTTGMIGFFSIQSNEISYERIPREDGYLQGSMLLPDANMKTPRGTVLYDDAAHQYIVTWKKNLTPAQKVALARVFGLNTAECEFRLPAYPIRMKHLTEKGNADVEAR